MSTNMPSTNLNLEAQLLSIMDVLARAAVAEISQLFSESSVSLRLQISQSLKENEALRMRMKVMRSELFALRLQTRTSASRPASRFSLGGKTITPRPRIKPLVLVKSPVPQKAVGDAAPISGPTEKETLSVASQAESAEVETPDVILIKDEEDIGGCRPASGQEDFGNHGTQGGGGVATGTPSMEASGSSLMAEKEKYMHQEEELQIISVHGRGEGPLAEETDTLFSASELQALSCLSPDHTINHDGLLSFHSGATERPLIRAMQDIGGMRDGTLERNQSSQMTSTLMKSAMKTALAADSKGGHPSHLSQPRQQHHQQQQQPTPILAHTINKSMDCSFCGERFPSREELIVHRATHTGESPIPCGLCGKPFVNKTTLAIHMRIHTGEKPYVCPQCGKRFTQNGSLKIHLRTHSGEKPYTCSRCTASFNNPSNLRRHMIIHTTNGVL